MGLLIISIVVFFIFKKNIFTTVDTSVKNSNSEYKISDNALSSFDLYFMQKKKIIIRIRFIVLFLLNMH